MRLIPSCSFVFYYLTLISLSYPQVWDILHPFHFIVILLDGHTINKSARGGFINVDIN